LLESFLQSEDKVFLLKGFAGTGKTTLIKGLTAFLNSNKKTFEVMAPTGRAAKILREKTGHGVTIHRGIYNFEKLINKGAQEIDEAKHSFKYIFPLKETDTTQKIIIVDEASMISSKESKDELFGFGTDVLLDDLLTYAFKNNSLNKIIFVGDPAQLQPVGDNTSWALEPTFFIQKNIGVKETTLTQIKRQDNNLIIENAMKIRSVLESEKRSELTLNYDESSFQKMAVGDLTSQYTSMFPIPEAENGVIISFSNTQCFYHNKGIRNIVFPNATHVVAGDLLLINNNNYHTYKTELFNGDIVKVVDVNDEVIVRSAPVWTKRNGKDERLTVKIEFRKIKIKTPQSPEVIDCLIIDSLLNSIDKNLSIDMIRALYIDFVIRFREEQDKRKEKGLPYHKVGSEVFNDELKIDPFYNALRVKYGYAITCHKAQGGEWEQVFVDYSGRVSLKNEPLRWCYTATTRGIKTVYAINAPHFAAFSKLRFSTLGRMGSLPNNALDLKNINLSPFHSENHHKCKSLKYWEIVQKLENTDFVIQNVISSDYLDKYVILYDNKSQLTLEGYHKKSGHYPEGFQVVQSADENLNNTITEIFNSDFNSELEINYSPDKTFLKALYSIIQAYCSELDIAITGVEEKN
jgi:hypothetical protein